jgi:hypothetical protein
MSVTKPVFSDETGRRAVVLLWVGRVVVAACVVLAGALAFTLTTHIALPGLDGVVGPTLNGGQPEVGLPTDPGTVDASDTPNVVSKLTATARAKSASSSSHHSTAVAVAGSRATKSSTTAIKRPAPAATSAQRTAKSRSSHAASPGSARRNVRPRDHPTPPGHTKKPVP